MPIQVSKTPSGEFTISLNHGDDIFQTHNVESVLLAVRHYVGQPHGDGWDCPLCLAAFLASRKGSEHA